MDIDNLDFAAAWHEYGQRNGDDPQEMAKRAKERSIVHALTPAEVRPRAVASLREAIVTIINERLKMGLLDFPGPRDDEGLVVWLAEHESIVAQFRQAGWTVTALPVVPPGYRFEDVTP